MSPAEARRPRWRRLAVALATVVAVLIAPPALAERPPLPGPVIEGAPPATWPQVVDVDAPSFVLMDATTGQVLGERAADDRREVASTVKILTALTVLDRADPHQLVTVGEEVLDIAGASVGLRPGDQWTVAQLLEGMLIRSGNDAAEALAAHVAGTGPAFVELMLTDLAALELPAGPDGIALASVSGLEEGNRLSARDLAMLARVALDDPVLRPIFATPQVTLPGVGTGPNRNELIGAYSGATGVKTGFTEAAGHSLVASAQRGERELIAVVLGVGPDPARFQAATALLDHGFAAFRQETLAAELVLVVAGGRATLTTAPATVAVPAPATVALDLRPPTIVAPDQRVRADLAVNGEIVGTVMAQLTAPPGPRLDGSQGVGRAFVDGAYAAMRAATREDAW